MYEKVNERSEALDDRIEDIAQIVKQHYNIPDFGDPAAVTEEETVVIGRITMDSESLSADSAKLNEASLVLEASRMMGSGARVPLKFDPGVRIRQAVKGLKGIGLFPGAIVALKGKNGGAGWFTVQEILSLPPLNPSQPSTSSEPFSMMVACGPYTSDGDLKFGPWQTLLSKIKADSPSVVLLTGPFLDANHPSIRTGDIDTTPAEIFRTNIIEPLQSYLDSNPGSLVVMIPSVRDIISDHTVYPQAALSVELVGDPRIQLLPNPSRFSLNGIVFAVSSVDVLFHLRKEEFTKRAAEVDSIESPGGGEAAVDPMSNLCRHVLQQRSFYPIFPVPYDLSHEVNLDVSHSEFLDFWSNEPEKAERPDVLILPSRLKQFVKVVDGVTAINPSFLTKATYASLRCSSGNPQAEIARLDG
ncbi:hypothetical protein K474DRAFT_1454783 [Panus rudis PR-1116 ss-1]|nr:hypothetical protein K474DRAFT_1454783 [Panus rudis PR-1116 ss-1]